VAVFENCSLIFPPPPPARDAKPLFKKGQGHQPKDKNSLWGSHDPAIFRDPVTGNYYTYCTGAVARRSRDLIVWENIGKVVDDPPPEAVAMGTDWSRHHQDSVRKYRGNMYRDSRMGLGAE